MHLGCISAASQAAAARCVCVCCRYREQLLDKHALRAELRRLLGTEVLKQVLYSLVPNVDELRHEHERQL